MTTVGTYEAKTNLPQLLERVARGEKILITRRGIPIAVMSPAQEQQADKVKLAMEAMLAYRALRKRTLGKISVRELIEAGRRF